MQINAPVSGNKKPRRASEQERDGVEQYFRNNRQDALTMEVDNAQAKVPATMAEKLAWLREILSDRTLTAGTKNVATALFMCHNQATGKCNPSQTHLGAAVGMHRQNVSAAVKALTAGGWIRQVRTRGTSYYVLHVDRGAVEMSAAADTRCLPERTADVCETRQQMSARSDRELSKELSKGTIQLNSEPAETASELEAQGPAEVSAMPVQPVPTPPAPANDDTADGRMISGWEIPGETIRQWKAGFKYIDLDAELTRSGPWFVANVPTGRRLSALASRLHKVNEANRIESVSRRKNREADAAAGVERCWTNGRIKNKGNGIPPGANKRYYMA